MSDETTRLGAPEPFDEPTRLAAPLIHLFREQNHDAKAACLVIVTTPDGVGVVAGGYRLPLQEEALQDVLVATSLLAEQLGLEVDIAVREKS